MIRTAEGRVVTIAGLGVWPRSISPDLFVREHGGTIPDGILLTVVPAAPDAWIRALHDFGTMSFGEVAAEAMRFARQGFPVYEYLAEQIAENAAGYARWPANAAIFLPNGRPPRVGERFVQTDLAACSTYMVDEERAAAKRGRQAGLERLARRSTKVTSRRASSPTTRRTGAT